MKQNRKSSKRALRIFVALVITIQPGRAVVGQSLRPHESQEREKQIETGLNLLREVVLKEAENLRLLENRVYVFKSSATILSKKSHEESTQLLERAIGQIDAEMVDLQNLPVQQPSRVADLRRLRDQVVLALSEIDPVRALRSVRASKGQPESDDSRTPADSALELLVLQKAAATDPAMVLERATKSLGGTLSPEVVETYEALRERDPEMGRQLGCAIVARLRDETPDAASPAGKTALALMADIASRQRGFVLDSSVLDGSSIRRLVTFVADLLLAQENPVSSSYRGDLTRFAGILENCAPSRVAQFRRRLGQLPPLAFGPLDMKELETSLQAKNYDDAARWARKAPVEARQYALGRIAEAQIENGQLERARSFVSSQITDTGTREELLGRLASAEAEVATHKVDEAPTGAMVPLPRPGDDRVSTLLSLARTAAENGDREKALAILEEARALPSDKSEQLKNEMVIAEACRKIDMSRCLEIVTAHIDRLNALLGASAVLDGYFGPECIQNGEIRYLSPLPLFPAVFTLCDVLGEIAMVDSDQGLRLARHIAGPELQMLAILTIAQHLVLGSDYRPNSDEPTFVQDRLAHLERTRK